ARLDHRRRSGRRRRHGVVQARRNAVFAIHHAFYGAFTGLAQGLATDAAVGRHRGRRMDRAGHDILLAVEKLYSRSRFPSNSRAESGVRGEIAFASARPKATITWLSSWL